MYNCSKKKKTNLNKVDVIMMLPHHIIFNEEGKKYSLKKASQHNLKRDPKHDLKPRRKK